MQPSENSSIAEKAGRLLSSRVFDVATGDINYR
jgi:hypothetical protein